MSAEAEVYPLEAAVPVAAVALEEVAEEKAPTVQPSQLVIAKATRLQAWLAYAPKDLDQRQVAKFATPGTLSVTEVRHFLNLDETAQKRLTGFVATLTKVLLSTPAQRV